MTNLSDGAVARLRDAVERPALPARYELVERIGAGGMGVVWRARDALLQRDVAVKVIAPHLVDEGFAERLWREARILARLEHPGIVPVHDVGELEDGRTWYTMRLVRGTRLDVAMATIGSRGELLRILERLCETVAYAHAHGVVHRDLKPGNVMLGPFGEVLVLDWGVARDRETSGEGEAVVGTRGYMSPEQATGAVTDERSDVFGLGAILRDLCAVHGSPVAGPLASIQTHAMEPDPANRYQSATEMRDDVRRFLDGARVKAHRETLFEGVERFTRTYQTPILLVAAYLIMRLAILIWRGV
jgi:serine/threonine protein kinase